MTNENELQRRITELTQELRRSRERIVYLESALANAGAVLSVRKDSEQEAKRTAESYRQRSENLDRQLASIKQQLEREQQHGTKQVIVIRRDLKMRRGKEIAQGAHASMSWLSWAFRRVLAGHNVVLTDAQTEWLEGLFAKICVQVNSEQELRDVHEAAVLAGIESHLITDSGRTEFNGQPTLTACAIGPDYADKIDPITKDLKLY